MHFDFASSHRRRANINRRAIEVPVLEILDFGWLLRFLIDMDLLTAKECRSYVCFLNTMFVHATFNSNDLRVEYAAPSRRSKKPRGRDSISGLLPVRKT